MPNNSTNMEKRVMKQHTATTWSSRTSLGFTCTWYTTTKLEAEMEGKTILRGFEEHETLEDILLDNDHTDTRNTVLGKQYTKEANKGLLTNK